MKVNDSLHYWLNKIGKISEKVSIKIEKVVQKLIFFKTIEEEKKVENKLEKVEDIPPWKLNLTRLLFCVSTPKTLFFKSYSL